MTMKPLKSGDPHMAGDIALRGRLGEGGMGTVYFGVTPDGARVAVKTIRRDLTETAVTITRRLHLAPGNRFLDLALSHLLSLDAKRLRAIAAGTFVYAGLLLTEGVGLLLRRRCAS